jgi:CHASE3 domain sensor protein
MVDYARKSAFTLHDYNAALDTWHQLVTTEDPQLQKTESRALRDSIRSALMAQLNQMSATTEDTSQKNLIATVVRGLQSMNVGLDDAARQSMIVMLARQDDAMFQAIAASQKAVFLSTLLIAFTVVAAGTLVVPMAWLYIRFKQQGNVQQVKL